MEFILKPWKLYFLILVRWVQTQQQKVTEYLRTDTGEIACKERLGGLLRYYHRAA